MPQYLNRIRSFWMNRIVLGLFEFFRKLKFQTKKVVPSEDWNTGWLGEEMRPYDGSQQTN
jgi:hypothetical protein